MCWNWRIKFFLKLKKSNFSEIENYNFFQYENSLPILNSKPILSLKTKNVENYRKWNSSFFSAEMMENFSSQPTFKIPTMAKKKEIFKYQRCFFARDIPRYYLTPLSRANRRKQWEPPTREKARDMKDGGSCNKNYEKKNKNRWVWMKGENELVGARTKKNLFKRRKYHYQWIIEEILVR